MKLCRSRSARPITFAVVVCFCLVIVHTARARQNAAALISEQQSAQKLTSARVNANNSSFILQDATRERRAQAYAKLLEGQRYLNAARRGSSDETSVRAAQDAFEQAAQFDPTFAEPHTALAEIAFFFLNDQERAEREASVAARLNKDNFGAHRVLSRVLTLKSRSRDGRIERAAADRAITELREVLRLFSSDAEAWALLGELYAGTNRNREAIEAFTRWATAPEPPPLEPRFYTFFTQKGELSPATANARLGEVLLGENRATEAIAAFRRAVALDADNREYAQLLAQALTTAAGSGEVASVVAIYEEMLKARGIANAPLKSDEDKEFAAGVLERIIAAQKAAGRTDDALATIERMRRLLGDDDASADFQLITLLREQGKRREALQAIQTARQRHPEESSFMLLEALTLGELGRVDEGVALLRARLTNTPADYNQYLYISSIYMQAGRGREAVEAARKALQLAPAEQPEFVNQALTALASAQERAGDPKGAEESLRRVLSSSPNDATALNNLGYFLVERNERLTEALEMIERAVRQDPTNSSYLDSLGWAYFKLGRLEEAEKYLSDAARRSQTSSTIHEHLGDLYQKQGKAQQARTAWQKALTLSSEPAEIARIKAKINGR
ncbi:MAG: tetratricopeptide repeat protein [Pyrinomonadaceae bacterium]|nr:tetratricopeptide repeat protein [Pyrinomonadaceae bacterium]